MSVHDAEPGDIYIDAHGDVWKVVGICKEPTVTMDYLGESGAKEARDRLSRLSGGVGGLMWNGFKRIYRKEA